MKKIMLLGLLSLPFLGFSQEFIKYGQGEAIVPMGNTSDIYVGGIGITGEAGISLFGALDITAYSGGQVIFKEKIQGLEVGVGGDPVYLVPVMAKARYYFIPVGVKPYISLAGGVVNTFDNNETTSTNDTFYALKPSVGVKFSKFLVDLSYLKSNKQNDFALETVNLSVGYKL